MTNTYGGQSAETYFSKACSVCTKHCTLRDKNPVFTETSQEICSLQAFQTKFCVHFLFRPCLLHALPISSSLMHQHY